MAVGRNRWPIAALAIIVTFVVWRQWTASPSSTGSFHQDMPEPDYQNVALPLPDPQYVWRRIKQNYPVESFRPLPGEPQTPLPPIQARFKAESSGDRATRLSHQKAIKDAFIRAWDSYKLFAWLRDEVTPVTGQKKDTFGGWGATLIDSLDTLWIMGMKHEFEIAVNAVDKEILFETTASKEINVFETTIRFLGGLISAYEMSGDVRLLSKARDAGDMLYKAFDTPNHLPVLRWNLRAAAEGEKQSAPSFALLAELGSLSMEFTRLSLLTQDPKYYHVVQHVGELFAAAQMKTKLPGMWPIVIDPQAENFDAGIEYSLGGMSDSTYEYLPKMVAVLGDANNIYGDMYLKSMETAEKHLLYRPMTPDSDDILFPGVLHVSRMNGEITTKLDTSTGHLSCFTGGMLALGGRLFSNETQVELGGKLTKGCVWAYHSLSTGVMPEVFHLQACPGFDSCPWDEDKWHEGIILKSSSADVMKTIAEERLPKGFTRISDSRYILRPEAIESVFIMYRITGDSYWRDRAWEMWTAIDQLTTCELANSAVSDVNPMEGKTAPKVDSMESFWMGETLKYFYLIFSEPHVVSLDDWVFNTEAHPFRRRKSA